jgi:HSP20 family protein
MTFVKVNQPARPFGNLLQDLINEVPGFVGKEVSKTFQQPPVNIVETEDGYQLELIAPGRQKEDFKVTVEKGLLTIAFEQKTENNPAELKVIRKEFSLTTFKRSFSVDEKIDTDNIQAKYENGLLKFFLPKKEEVKVQPQSISIQ